MPATLWERVSGYNLPDNPAPADAKIPIHGFWGMIAEWQRGYETQNNVINAFSLVGDQLTDAAVIKQNINQITSLNGQTSFIRMSKDWSYVAEIVGDPADQYAGKYLDWDAFVTRMNNEVIDQGGTPPA